MCLTVEPKAAPEPLAFRGRSRSTATSRPAQCYAHFQMALMGHGLWEYYLTSRDIEAPRPDHRLRRLMTHHASSRTAGQASRLDLRLGRTNCGPVHLGGRRRERAAAGTTNCVEVMGWAAVAHRPEDTSRSGKDAVARTARASTSPQGCGPPRSRPSRRPRRSRDLKAEATGGGQGETDLDRAGRAGQGRPLPGQVRDVQDGGTASPAGRTDRAAAPGRQGVEARVGRIPQEAAWPSGQATNLPNVPDGPARPQGREHGGLGAPTGHDYFAVKSWTAGDR